MPKPDDAELLQIDGREVRISHPAKPYFTLEAQLAKIDLVRYYLAVAPGALMGIQDRPLVLKRFVDGAHGEPFYQKRAPDPKSRPAWLRTVTLAFPSGRTAEEIVVDDAAGLAWVVNLGSFELHPHPVRTADLDHPDELRVDLDPGPGVPWSDVRLVALEIQALLTDLGLTGWPKTSGSRGIHINLRIHPRWTFTEVRRAALALSRAVERRAPTLATSKWWKEERHGVFLDYNQNAKDRTTCSAYSVRPVPDARVSAPLHWHEVPDCEPADFNVFTMPARFAALGDPHAAIDQHPNSLDPLLELAAQDEASGQTDAPWPPHFAKAANEPARVQPSKARKSTTAKPFAHQLGEGFGPQRFRKRSKALTEPAMKAGPKAPEAGAPSMTASPSLVGSDASGHSEPDAIDPGAPPSPSASPTETVGSDATPKPRKAPARRTPKFPLLTIAQSPDRAAAEAGLDRWRTAHPEAAAHLTPDDILLDRMRGSAYVWYRIRLNLRHIPDPLRPLQETPDPDDDPTRAWRTRETV